MTKTKTKPRFPLGDIVTTRGATDAFADAAQIEGESRTAGEIGYALLKRHWTGDWGDLCEEDVRANDRALIEGTRLLSAYQLATGVKIWIITEADRSSTTFLLPEEY